MSNAPTHADLELRIQNVLETINRNYAESDDERNHFACDLARKVMPTYIRAQFELLDRYQPLGKIRNYDMVNATCAVLVNMALWMVPDSINGKPITKSDKSRVIGMFTDTFTYLMKAAEDIKAEGVYFEIIRHGKPS
jgi:hypothetical protein